MGSGALITVKAIDSKGASSLGSGTYDANSFLVASTSSLAAASLAAAAFSSASSASLFAFAAASLASAPLVLGVGCSWARACEQESWAGLGSLPLTGGTQSSAPYLVLFFYFISKLFNLADIS